MSTLSTLSNIIFTMPPSSIAPNNNGVARKGMSSVLQRHYLGVHKLRIGNVTCTEMVRPLSERGLQQLAKSI